ncbi:hypothetical protein [Abyssalbus ytuae]|uniref:Tetratricopeptide repeat protein n=1 Tax=Abyssalbus ytuae TaxID=2926907 RepID=A0A9E6ZK93_9FLAO|nr:hypothetical protein [Abyssalbus ytuae]UOB16084.1 hypothetical protein MQE35_10075 [Abyssalbus ytuae]
MKKLIIVFALGFGFFVQAQNNSDLKKHYEVYYKQMRKQGDVRGAINALTHLLVLQPGQARKDTLAYLYTNAGQYVQAINVLGVEKNTSDSDLAVEVKAVALKSLNQPQLAVQQYDILFGRKPDVFLAYDLVDLNLQIGKTAEAKTYIDYGLGNATEKDMIPFYDANRPYQVPAKAAFTYQNGLLYYNEHKTDIDGAVKMIDEAIVLAPDFLLAKQIKEILLKQKNAAPATDTNKK